MGYGSIESGRRQKKILTSVGGIIRNDAFDETAVGIRDPRGA